MMIEARISGIFAGSLTAIIAHFCTRGMFPTIEEQKVIMAMLEQILRYECNNAERLNRISVTLDKQILSFARYTV